MVNVLQGSRAASIAAAPSLSLTPLPGLNNRPLQLGALAEGVGVGKLESEVGRVASWVTLPCPGRALAEADCTILLPHPLCPQPFLLEPMMGFGAMRVPWAGQWVRDLQVGSKPWCKSVCYTWVGNLDSYRHLSLVTQYWDIDRA